MPTPNNSIGVAVQKQNGFLPTPFLITDALVAKTKEAADKWREKPDGQIAQTIVNAIATEEIKKVLAKIKENTLKHGAELSTCITLNLPDNMRASIPITMNVSPNLIEVYPNYRKSQKNKTANA